MSVFAIYAILLPFILSLYLIKNKQLSFNDFKDSYMFLSEMLIKAVRDKENKHDISISNQKEQLVNLELEKSLKHLEFMSQLEAYLEETDGSVMSVEFLQEFETSKREAQLTFLKSTHKAPLAA
ncbi:hypothetical protein [Winogradskyella sp. PE311]|uniref:hypothetical protein n=1 Tax=Winogradskyella sp. PE311 TaxID=3366943 RepID=UPI00397F515C